MGRLCLIPARGGSKRIPRKNIRLFFDQPIIAYSIKAAIKSGLFDEVMVSTDDKEIAEVALKFGAKVPFMRSRKNADDHATTADVILEVLDSYKKLGLEFSHACCLYPTAPLVNINRLNEGYNQLINNAYTTVFPVAEFSYPIWRSVQINSENKLEMNWPEHLLTRSQDLPGAWQDCGQFYWFDTKLFTREPKLVGSNTGYIKMQPYEFQDIDTLIDWEVAELKYEYLKNR